MQPRKIFDDIQIGKDIFEEYVDFEKSQLKDPMTDGPYPQQLEKYLHGLDQYELNSGPKEDEKRLLAQFTNQELTVKPDVTRNVYSNNYQAS